MDVGTARPDYMFHGYMVFSVAYMVNFWLVPISISYTRL